jgi:hypothetical protein
MGIKYWQLIARIESFRPGILATGLYHRHYAWTRFGAITKSAI